MKFSTNLLSNLRLYVFYLFIAINSHINALPNITLEKYGNLKTENITIILQRALNDIDNKCLILPKGILSIKDVQIENKKNFKIKGDSTIIQCGKFDIKNCNNFDISQIQVHGTINKFAYFNIIGNCYRFSIHHCSFYSEKDNNQNNTFYGIHIMCDKSQTQKSFNNSPREFKIYQNKIKNTRFDGILIQALCSNFKIYKNSIQDSQCIGIEIEGRLGNNKNTTVFPCKQGNIYNNNITNCGDWGILLMWVQNVNIYNNICNNNNGCFLSIGSQNIHIYKNSFEGTQKGFEISQEYYSINKGINDNIWIYKNKIIGRPRAEQRGVIDIRHARNIS